MRYFLAWPFGVLAALIGAVALGLGWVADKIAGDC
jgi:hypothetical protein